MRTFEKFLEEVCFNVNPSVLDDDMPDFFNNWLGNLDGEDYIKWGDLYGQECFIKGQDEVLEKLSE